MGQSSCNKNDKCLRHYNQLNQLIGNSEIIEPTWMNEEFFRSHKSNLLRKNSDYYGELYPDVPDNLEYDWPER